MGSLRLLGRTVLLLVISLGVAEIVLQAAALLARGRETPGSAGRRILCVGDSHTYGARVPPDQSYPGHLQRLLDAEAPGTYAVINLGIPGLNTSQVRTRLRAALDRYRPELVIVWCGVNDAWNRRGSAGEAGWWPALDEALGRLRTWRLLRVWQHDRQLASVLGDVGSVPQQRFEIETDPADPSNRFTARLGGREERFEYAETTLNADAEMERRAEDDYRAMVEDTRAAGVPIVFIAYPVEESAFTRANRAMRRVAAAAGAPVVEAAKAALRVPEPDRQLLWAAHPTGPIYAEVARDLVPIVRGGGAAARGERTLARLGFEEERAGGERAAVLTGPCRTSTSGCLTGTCYAWNPRAVRCSVETTLTDAASVVRVSLALRVSAFPAASGGRDILGLYEAAYGTGSYLELTEDGQLQLVSLGTGRSTCGPLGTRLRADTWYAVRVGAEKSMHARATIELLDPAGQLLDSATCTDQGAGGGFFTQLRVGSGNPSGSTADVRIDDVDVHGDPAASPAGRG